MIRVAVQERRFLLREGLHLVLKEDSAIEVVGVVGSLEELAKLTTEETVDVLVIDLDDLADGEGAAAVSQLRATPGATNARLVGLVGAGTPDRIVRVRTVGVDLVIERNRGTAAVIEAVTCRQVRVLPRTRRVRCSNGVEHRLSERELEVLRLLAGGWTTLDVARAMSISPKTVENHKQRIFTKLDARNAAHAVAVAARLGLVAEPFEYAAVGS